MANPAYAVRILRSTNWHPLASTKYFDRDRLFKGPTAKKKAEAFLKRWEKEYAAWRKAKGYDLNFNLRRCFLVGTVVRA